MSLCELPAINACNDPVCAGVNVQCGLELPAKLGAGYTTVQPCTGVGQVAGHGTGEWTQICAAGACCIAQKMRFVKMSTKLLRNSGFNSEFTIQFKLSNRY